MYLSAVAYLVVGGYALLHRRHVRIDVIYERLAPRTFRLDVLSGHLDILELTLPNGRKKTYSERIRVTESNPLVLS